MFLRCPEGAAVIWILQIIYFSFCLMNWKIEGGGKKKASVEEFKRGQGGGTKTEDTFEEKVL